MIRVSLVLLALALAPAPAFAQRAMGPTHATAPQPSRIVLERTEVDWCFDQVRGRVDLTAAVRRRVGHKLALHARPDDLVDLPGEVVARPWANFVVEGKHPLEIPPRTNPAIAVAITAEANGGTAIETLTIHAGPRAERGCRKKIEEAKR